MTIQEWRNYYESIGRMDMVEQMDKELKKQQPKRENVIQKDDVTNLKITLGGEKDVLDIIKEL